MTVLRSDNFHLALEFDRVCDQRLPQRHKMISTRLDLIGVLVLDFGNLVLLISLLMPGFGSIEAIFRFVDQGIDRFLKHHLCNIQLLAHGNTSF